MGQINASAFTSYDPTKAGSIKAGPLALYTVAVGSIDPTQVDEGLVEVGKKASAHDLQTPAQIAATVATTIEPVVIGPGGQLYITDGHHTFTALEDSDFGNSIAEVLRNTTDRAGGAVILDPTSGDTVKLAGITKGGLARNRADFAFHG